MMVNLFELPEGRGGDGAGPAGSGELLDTLLRAEGVRIERIVSRGHVTPPGAWYDQEGGEWVAVLEGSAVLRFEEGDRRVELKRGDSVFIPPHARHRVEWTDPEGPTIWLAVHLDASLT